MARPLDHDKRVQIASAAVETMKQRGIANTRMSDVASAAGMKRPTLYHYFSDLDEILEFQLELWREREVAWVTERIMGVSHPVDLLSAYVRGVASFYRHEGPEEFLILMSQLWSAGDQVSRDRKIKLTAHEVAPLRQMLVGALTLGQKTGQVGPCDPEAVVDLCLAWIDGATLHTVILGVDPEPALNTLQTQILAPLRREPETS